MLRRKIRENLQTVAGKKRTPPSIAWEKNPASFDSKPGGKIRKFTNLLTGKYREIRQLISEMSVEKKIVKFVDRLR